MPTATHNLTFALEGLTTRDMGASKNRGTLFGGVRIIRILLFRVLYWGPLFPETPTSECER